VEEMLMEVGVVLSGALALVLFLLFWSTYKEYSDIRRYRQNISNGANWSVWHEKDFERWRNQLPCMEGREVSLFVVLGSGGHTAEMIQILQAFGRHGLDSFCVQGKVTYIVASSDPHSMVRARCLHEKNGVLASYSYQFLVIPRSRYVGQSYFSSIFSTSYSLVVSWWKIIVGTEAPDILLCNGPGTCVPIVLITFVRNVVYRLLQKRRTRIVFIESVARVHSLSLSGRILYPLAHRFLVQWPELRDKYPRVEYIGLCL